MTDEYVIAKYLRLSIEDEKTESLSIENQHLTIDSHIDSLDIPNARILTFVDNGHSGTNMERPAVQEMLELVRSGGVNLIIIKDFSRFSRNSMDSGYFIEQVFPLYQVRLIAITDDYDSNDYTGDTGGIDIAFKFLMHEHYSKDLSVKVRTAKRLQMKRGENIVARTVYGYYKADSGKWEPDGDASEVVKKIYGCALDGLSPSQIRDKLFAERIPTPQEYLDLGRGKDIKPEFLWGAKAVTRILTNVQYSGTYVSGKQEQKAIGSHSKNWNPKSEWIVIPNRHTPIIEPEMFERIQEIMKAFLTSEPTPKSAKHCQSADIPTEHSTRVLPYGYVFDGGDGWILDKTASAAVRRIFDLSLQGAFEADIAETLKAEKIPTPLEHRRLKRGKDITTACAWRVKGIRDILRDVQYTGVLVRGKFGVKADGSGHYRTHESDWIHIPDKLPAIVSADEFKTANAFITGHGRKYGAPSHLLRGNILKCGCCGYALTYDKLSDPVYRCYHTAANPDADCHKLKIAAKQLDGIVLAAIRRKAQIVLDCADLSKLRRKTADEHKISDAESTIRQIAREKQSLYERFVLGEISRDEYREMKDDCSAKSDRLNRQLAAMKSELDAGKVSPRSVSVAKSAVRENTNERELVETLIGSVRVYNDMRVDINWKIREFGKLR